ncbi:MAG TPA: competence/damage-inducible protein A [Spirochaetota bacterium]
MVVEILSIGTEILLGDIVNTNTHFLSKRLADLGFSVYRHTSVGDNPERLRDAIVTAFQSADMVIATGGLGPTKDDLSKETAADVFGLKLVMHEGQLTKLKGFFEKLGREMTDNNIKQALIPEGAYILENDFGTAPGFAVEKNGKHIIMFPGPPREMIPMFENKVVPYLARFQDSVLVSKVLRIAGIGESAMEEKVADIMDSQTNPTIAPYAKDGECILRITAKGKDEYEAASLIAPMEERVRARLGDNIYGIGNDTIESVCAQILIKRRMTLAIAESCTGGLLTSRFVSYPGVSKTLLESVVCYSNNAKINRLGVRWETIDKWGAVSEETAREMAYGIAKTAEADVGIATTGVAGPDGGTPEKPVGLVWVALCIKGEIISKRLMITGERDAVRLRAAMQTADFLRRELLKR